MRAGLYARVSTEDQDCALQLDSLRAYCQSRRWEVSDTYIDQGWSGAKLERPELRRLKADARERKIDVVLVWKLDRWGRSTVDAIQGIQELLGLGVRWIAVTQNLDTDESNPMARFMLHIMAAFAELEREMIRERVGAGMKAARHRGKHCGRPKKIVDKRRVREMRDRGMSVRDIAATFKARGVKIGKSSIAAMLKSAAVFIAFWMAVLALRAASKLA